MRIAHFTAALLLAAGTLLFRTEASRAVGECAIPNAHTCIDVGQTVRLEVTHELLGLYCVTPDLKPDHERIQLGFSGEPRSGGAGAIFKPSDVIRAYESPATLEVKTTTLTRPGRFIMSITGRGERCGRYPGFEWHLIVRPKIIGPDRLWSFKGAKPAGYPTEITQTALPAGLPYYDWRIIGSEFWLKFPNGQSAIRTTTNKVKVSAVRPTKPDDQAAVSVAFGQWALSTPHVLRVLTPRALEWRYTSHVPNPDRGYRSVSEYVAVDQYGRRLPARAIPVEVVWESPQTEILQDNNWTRGPSGVRALANPRQLRLAIVPRTDGGLPINVGYPRPLPPGTQALKIDCWKAGIFLGGDATHPGVKVDAQFWLRYRDHATTEASSCP